MPSIRFSSSKMAGELGDPCILTANEPYSLSELRRTGANRPYSAKVTKGRQRILTNHRTFFTRRAPSFAPRATKGRQRAQRRTILTTDEHLCSLMSFSRGLRGCSRISAGCYEKLCCCAAHAARRVGRRVAPESTAAALSGRNDGQQSFSQPIRVN